MSTPPAVLMVELVMSIDRMIQSAQKSGDRPAEWLIGSDDEWSPSVVLGHILEVDELVWIPRLTTMCQAQADNQSAPEFSWWEPDPVATRAKFENQPLEEVAALAMATRTVLLTKVRDLTAEQWQAQGIHDVFGAIDVRELLIQVLTHDEEHRASLV